MNSLYKIFISVLLTFIHFNPAFAQDAHKMDSLIVVLKTAKEDTNKVNVLIDMSKLYWQISEYDSSRKYANDAIVLSEKVGFKKGKGFALNSIGISYYYEGNYKESLKYQFEALKLHKEAGDKSGIAASYNGIGIIYDEQGNFSDALKYYFNALKLFEELNDKRKIASALGNIAIVYYEQSNYSDALSNHFTALKICKELKDQRMMASSYENIANIYADQNKYTEALEYYLASLTIRKEMGNRHGIANSYVNIGAVYEEQGNEEYSSGNKVKAEKKYSEALNNYQNGLKIFQEIGEQASIPQCFTHIGSINVKQKKFPEARINLNNALKLSKLIGNKYEIKNCYRGLSVIDSSTGNYAEAFKNYKLYTFFKDSLLNESNSRQAAEMKEKYESEKKEGEIALLTQNKEIQNIEIKKQTLLKNSLIGGLALALALFYFIYNSYRTKQKLKLENIRNNIAADLHDDIGSTLNSISLFSEVAKNEAGKPIPALDQIGISSRKIIDAMSDIVWTINPENDTFENVVSRMRSLAYMLLKAKEIEFVFKADEGLNQLSLPMLARKNVYLLFKEATNNIVKYSNASRASFHISHENKNVKMVIRDNGVGFDMENAQMGNGIKNMKKRAAEIGGQFLIESAEGKGTNIELSFKA